MEREQIVKALGMCTASRPKCKECPYFIGDIRCKHSKLLKDAIALINELIEGNESLKELGTTKEIEKELVRRQTKADTVRKMQLEIKSRCIEGGIYPAFVERTVDQIAKEILEENENGQRENN